MAHDANRMVGRGRGSAVGAAGFTIVELLVVVAVIILLLSVIVVATSAASRSAAKSKTQFLMTELKKGLVTFKTDIGYYPPVLGVPYTTTSGQTGTPSANDLRRLYANSVPDPSAAYSGGNLRDHMQEYWSSCALAEYLVGYDHHYRDGYGQVPTGGAIPYPLNWNNETPALGIRHPSPDGIWGAAAPPYTGGVDDRMKFNLPFAQPNQPPRPWDTGKVYGPYIELKDERLLAAISGYDQNGPILHFPGDALPPGQTWESLPKTIVDYWGMPIRYYRQPHPKGALNQAFRAGVDYNNNGITDDYVPTLADVFVLRPWDLKAGVDVCSKFRDDNPHTFPDCAGNMGAGDPSTASHLFSAEIALFSPGPDKQADDRVRVDADNEYNKDNIVEVGP